MTTKEIREKYLEFFKKRGHKEIAPSPLVLENDPTTLFTSSGMQQMVPYLKGEKHSQGTRLVDSQPALRLQDLEDVGDNRHDTLFEMLGNWSLGDYFKEEQLNWIWKFFTEELKLDPKKIHVTVFEGNDQVPKDIESYDIFKIDVFDLIIKRVEKEVGIPYGSDTKKDRSFRIIADHLRTSCNLLAEGVIPSNKLHGYVLRRIIRRAMFHFHLLGTGISGTTISAVAQDLKNNYPNIDKNWPFIEENLISEATRFESALKRGLAKLTKAVSDGLEIDGKFAFDLFQNDGFPLELTLEILSQNGIAFSPIEKNSFESEFEKHKENSRSMSAGIFKGGLENAADETIKKIHTATHLLNESLKKILGEHVLKKRSHITNERLRFDFSQPNKLTEQ